MDDIIDYSGLLKAQPRLEMIGLYRGQDPDSFYERFVRASKVQKYCVARLANSSTGSQVATCPVVFGIGSDDGRGHLDLILTPNIPSFDWNKLPIFHSRFQGTEMEKLMARDSTGLTNPTLRCIIFVADNLSTESLSRLPKLVDGYQKDAFHKVIRVVVNTLTVSPASSQTVPTHLL